VRPGWMRNGESWSAAQRGALVSVGYPGGTTAGFCRLPMPSGWPRNEARAFGRPLGPARSGRWRIELSIRPVLKHGPRSLTCMRAGGWQTHRGASNLTGGIRKEHHRPTMIFCERFECEHTCWDPKDGELCLSRAKPEETLVEARSDTDVQIVRQTWV
jgi:hypothetical protein